MNICADFKNIATYIFDIDNWQYEFVEHKAYNFNENAENYYGVFQNEEDKKKIYTKIDSDMGKIKSEDGNLEEKKFAKKKWDGTIN
jgi:hypothetical protein